MNILAIIPARAGSKSVPHKNIRMIGGKPMLAHSIDHAKASKYITRVIVSTDSEEYAGIAREYGAEVPFIRPEGLFSCCFSSIPGLAVVVPRKGSHFVFHEEVAQHTSRTSLKLRIDCSAKELAIAARVRT